MAAQVYKYRREDFGELSVRLNHLTIYLNFLDGYVEASNCLDMSARKPLDRIELDANNLEIVSVEWLESGPASAKGGRSLSYEYLRETCKLVVTLPRQVRTDERFYVRTLTRCVPSDHILEGIYRDVTPEGAPQQYVSQCQQWGFQRIMPIFDDCRAKCTMTTTIEADRAYTHLISNGNISRATNPAGVPVSKPGDPTRQVITYENSIPMAPYLFLVCAGTWDALVDSVTYDSGGIVRLEYLVPPGRSAGAHLPMEILKEAVLWVAKTQDYKYVADTYRTICMTKSNFGGMENVGNTTIVTDAALIDEHTLDRALIYAHSVIVHEFEHNQCGSETTMDTPFDVWLNEAYTVLVERQFLTDIFDPTFIRLSEVDAIRSPLLGPMAIEDSGRAGRIVREGFDDPDDLIDGVTYVKAPEVIRMLLLTLGSERFRAGKELYFTRYKHGNANTDQFFECFEEVSGRSLTHFKQGWLYTIGYPRISATTEYDAGTKEYRVRFRQNVELDRSPWHVPIAVALVDEQGRTVEGTEQVFQLEEEEAVLVFKDLSEPPAFASLNRDYSFYGTFTEEGVTSASLVQRAKLDSNLFNRVEAMRALTDRQRVRLLSQPDAEVEVEWLSLYGEILMDQGLPPGLKSYFLRIDEQPMDREFATWYPELVEARERLMLEVNRSYRNELVELFQSLDTYRARRSPKDGIEERGLKAVTLGLIAVDDSLESHRMIIEHFERATSAADRVSALTALNCSSAHERRQYLEKVYEQWHSHTSGYPNYLRVVSSGTCDDVFDLIDAERSRDTFDVNQPSLCRALFLTMAANNKMVWTDTGIRWVTYSVIYLAGINQYTASRLLNTFQQYRKLRPYLQEKVRPALNRIVEKVPAEVSPTVHAQAQAYLGRAD